ncbi:MAG: hypothetical protein FWF79_09675 [Defluviitaleaceae bacterium]|nr:hypothetical protein [Defluviitaleaceae bacterium]
MKSFLKKEWAKMSEMSAAEKRWYLWEYYKLHFFAFFSIVFFIGYIINIRFINPPMRDYMYIAWVGEALPHFQLLEIGEQLSVIVEDPERQIVSVTDYSFTDNPQVNMALQTRFMGLLQMGALDVFITTREGVYGFIEEGFIRTVYDVTGFLAENNPQVYNELELFVVEPYAAAVSLENSPFMQRLGIDTSDLYLCVVVNTERFYEISKALEVLFYGA